MPFTPFHMGPALLIKATAGPYFSLLIFGGSQVAMDIEPLIRLIRRDTTVHGFTHTYLGATFLAIVCVFIGWPLCNFILKRLPRDIGSPLLNQLRGSGHISLAVAALSAFVGTYSHIVLDSIMHGDMHPLFPFSQTNALLGLISIKALHAICVLTGMVGALVILLLPARAEKNDHSTDNNINFK